MLAMTLALVPTRSEIRAAMIDIAPALLALVPIGLLFGALAAARGMSPLDVLLMSTLVFAGGAQFAVLELWQRPLPVSAILLSTVLINARHILMGASLAPKLGRFRAAQRFLAVAIMADENWALSERRATRHPLTPRYFVSMGIVFWASWVLWSTLGAVLGPALGDPKRFGADFAFVAIFIGLIVALTKTKRSVGTVIASAAVAALVHATLGSPWHVLSGALAGTAAAASLYRRDGEA
jgi:4-azaleucine resistance transporter AzlC